MPGAYHILLAAPGLASSLGGHLVEARLQPIVIDVPDAAPMPPGALDQAVVERQAGDIQPHIGGALYIGVPAEDVGARAVKADVAGGQQGNAGSTHIGGADGLLRLAHAPDQGRRFHLGEHLGDAFQLLARNAGDAFDLFGVPFGDFLAHVVHAVDALLDEVLVLPAVLKDVPEHAPEHRNVCARADTHIFGRMSGRTGHPRIDNDHIGVIDLLAAQQVLQQHRMRLGRVAAHDDHGFGVADIVVRIRLGAVTPDIGHACHRGRMADACLMVDRIRAPEGAEFSHQISTFIGEFGGAEPEDRENPRRSCCECRAVGRRSH